MYRGKEQDWSSGAPLTTIVCGGGNTMMMECNGASLHYDVHGEGEPLLWLHGFMGSGADWTHVFGAAPAGVRLIAPDLRGHGRSTNPSGDFRFRQVAEDVIALLDHLELERVTAIGLSGGGIALLHLATQQPGRISSMVLVSAPPVFPEQARAIQRQFSEAMLSEGERSALRERHPGGEAQIAALFAHARAFAERDDDVAFTPADLSRISARSLIVFGDRDPLYPVSLAVDLYRSIPTSYLWVVPNAGHAPVFGAHAEAFRSAAWAFLREDRDRDTAQAR